MECPIIKVNSVVVDYVNRFNSDEELLRSGGLPTEMLDTLAFGFNSESIKSLMPNQLSIKWKDDLENVRYEINNLYKKTNSNNLKKTTLDWANSVNLTEPIDVSFEKNKFFIEDGHHRYFAAKILNKPLNVNLEIKQNPIIKLSPKLSYDNFHRCLFKQVKSVNINEDDEYKGSHQAPNKHGDAPIYDLTPMFGNDIYSNNAARYYGHGSRLDDQLCVDIIHKLRNKPNARVMIYRSIPKIITNTDKIGLYREHIAYIQKYGKLPKGVDNWRNRSDYYEYLSNEIERLLNDPKTINEKPIEINDGDWVTISKDYAKQHGISNLNNSYRILSKTVLAKQLFSDGNSLQEFGYNI